MTAAAGQDQFCTPTSYLQQAPLVGAGGNGCSSQEAHNKQGLV